MSIVAQCLYCGVEMGDFAECAFNSAGYGEQLEDNFRYEFCSDECYLNALKLQPEENKDKLLKLIDEVEYEELIK